MKVLSAPLSTTINITEQCNLSCIYCYASTSAHEPVHMPSDKAIGLIKELHKKNVWKIVVAGGEPFLHPDILYILRSVLSEGIRLAVLSNGSVLSAVYNDLLKICRQYNNLLQLQISVDGHNPFTNDKTRGAGKTIFQVIKKLAKDGVELQLATVITIHNAESVNKIIEHFYPGIKRYHIMNVMPSRRSISQKEPLEVPGPKLMEVITDLEKLKNAHDDLKISLPFEFFPQNDIIPEMDCPGCVAGYTRMDINANGDVLACHMADYSIMGNIYLSSIDDIWNSNKAKIYREMNYPLCRSNFENTSA